MIGVQHIVAFGISETIALFSCPVITLYELFKNTISYGQARDSTYVLFALLVNLTEMFRKNNSQKIRCNMHIPLKYMSNANI